MRFTGISVTFVALAASSGAFAAPLDNDSQFSELARRGPRDNEMIYLARCGTGPTDDKYRNKYVYFNEGHAEVAGSTAANSNWSDYHTGIFTASGVNVWTRIRAGATPQTSGDEVGVASNGDRYFLCFKSQPNQIVAQSSQAPGNGPCKAIITCKHFKNQ